LNTITTNENIFRGKISNVDNKQITEDINNKLKKNKAYEEEIDVTSKRNSLTNKNNNNVMYYYPNNVENYGFVNISFEEKYDSLPETKFNIKSSIENQSKKQNLRQSVNLFESNKLGEDW
jgi:hypothetical protein